MKPVSEIRIVNLPGADIQPDNFCTFDASLPARLPDDSVLLRTDWFGVNAGMRSRMGATPASASNQKELTQRYPGRFGVGDGRQRDSGARGHLGVEADAVLDELGVERAAFVLAQPTVRRITVGGYHLDDGRLGGDSTTGRDLLRPVPPPYLPYQPASPSRNARRQVPLRTGKNGAG